MKIGEKIKKLRTAKLMTQTDLVGTEITRNMLSQIENGSANPSLETVCSIAARLNVSPGFLLADSEDELIYVKHNEMSGIKKSFMTEDYRICRDMCLNSDGIDDDEMRMLLCECSLAIGIEEFSNGHLRECCEFLDEAIDGCSKTIYRTDYVVAAAGIYFRYLQRISATLSSDIIDENKVNIYPAMTDEFCRYVLMLERFDGGDIPTEEEIQKIGKQDSPYVMHLIAMRCMGEGDYARAYSCLHSVLLGDVAVPQPVLYSLFCDLEICCKETENFKGAYEYSIDKIELLQKLLS